MKNWAALILVLVSLNLAGCVIGGLAKMTPIEPVSETQNNLAIINFVRPRVFQGDALAKDIWDGNKFIGTLVAGTMIQYLASPGEHIFLLDSQHNGWSHKVVNVIVGKTYYLKPNQIPFAGPSLGLAESDDPRITVWKNKLTPVKVQNIKDGKIEGKKLQVKGILKKISEK